MKSLIFSFTLFSFLYGEAAYGEAAYVGGDTFKVSGRSVLIINREDIDIPFSIRPAYGRWSMYIVKGCNNMSTWCRKNIQIKCRKCETFEIKIEANGVEAKYRLKASRKYSIRWNKKKKLWDVFLVD